MLMVLRVTSLEIAFTRREAPMRIIWSLVLPTQIKNHRLKTWSMRSKRATKRKNVKSERRRIHNQRMRIKSQRITKRHWKTSSQLKNYLPTPTKVKTRELLTTKSGDTTQFILVKSWEKDTSLFKNLAGVTSVQFGSRETHATILLLR